LTGHFYVGKVLRLQGTGGAVVGAVLLLEKFGYVWYFVHT